MCTPYQTLTAMQSILYEQLYSTLVTNQHKKNTINISLTAISVSPLKKFTKYFVLKHPNIPVTQVLLLWPGIASLPSVLALNKKGSNL